VFGQLLDAVPPLAHRRRRPAKLHADKAYDGEPCRAACRRRHIVPRIAPRRIEPSDRLGRHRWVVERTFAWLTRFRRLVVRYERRAALLRAFLHLASALICFKALQRL
jgi:transposase